MSVPQRSLGRVRPFLLLTTVCVLAACGRSLSDMAGEALDACITTRNPLFTAGRGAEALDTPLPPAAEALASKLSYTRASEMFQEVAKEAQDQVTLVCALDLASRWRTREAQVFLRKYTKHPDAAVAAAATRLAAQPVRD
ncbi:MAG: hypothetical protein MUD17_02225 [Gemmatimonadaceae bacterium]|nr:hypothetical protein [Gemmatimonadaceae bacterium]